MSSLGIFDKETKTYKKVADLSKTAVVDSAMSDSSANPVQNKVIKSYVDGRTTLDTSMSDTSTKAVQNKVIKSYVDNSIAGIADMIDTSMSDSSANPVQNKVIKSYVDGRTTLDTSMSDTSTKAVQNKVIKKYVDDHTSSVAWNNITGKPSTYTPSSHTHTKSQITDFPSSLPANGGNSATVNGHTVNSDVPSGAKFTDTKVTNILDKRTKAYVTGTTSASTNTGTQIFDTGVYLGTGTGQLILEGSNNVNYGTGAAILNVEIPPSHNNILYGANIVPYKDDSTDYVTGLNINCGTSKGPGMTAIDVTCSVDNYQPTVHINRSGTNSYALQVPDGKSYIATIYSNSSTITTSDREKKTDIQNISDKYEELFFKLQPRLFKFKDGTSGRIHIGAIAQEVEEALKEVGISDTDFAGFVRQEKEYVVNEETGEITQEEGYDYYLRYEEFVMLLCHMLQKLYAEKEEKANKISDLESRIVALESKLG